MPVPYRDLIEEAADQVLRQFGSNEVQRREAMQVLPGRDLEMRHGTVIVKAIGEPLDSDTGRDWLRKNKTHLLPPEAASMAKSANRTIDGKPLRGRVA